MSEPMPLYRQIFEDLRSQIESGELSPGDQLKSEAELMEEYGRDGKASRNTVRDAVRLLVGRGLVETRAGQGTFVVRKTQPFLTRLTLDPESGGFEDEIFRSEAQRHGREPEETTPRVEVQPASALVAARLGVAEGTPVISRHQERSIDGTPWSLQTVYYPMEFVTGGGATDLLVPGDISGGQTEGVLKYLESTLGVKQAGLRDMIIARPPRGPEKRFFGLSDKVQVAVVELQRASYDEDGKPIRFALTVYPADRNQFEMVMGRVPPPDTTAPDESSPTESSADGEEAPSGSGSSPDDKALDSAAGS
jgi:GntR family transcriptional regulator